MQPQQGRVALVIRPVHTSYSPAQSEWESPKRRADSSGMLLGKVANEKIWFAKDVIEAR